MELRGPALIHLIALATLANVACASAPSDWRTFTKADGLAENVCLTVTLGANGDVLVGHLNPPLISSLDGYDVTNLPAPIAKVSRVYESPGGQLWAIGSDGLLEFRDTNWVLHRVPEIAAQFRHGLTNSPISVLPVRQGRVLVLLQDRLLQFDADNAARAQVETLQRADRLSIGAFRVLASTRDGGLWVAGERGLAKVAGPLRNLKPDGEAVEFIPTVGLGIRNFMTIQESETGEVDSLAEDAAGEKLLAHFDGKNWSAHELNVKDVRFAWRGDDCSRMATRDAVFELRDGQTEPERLMETSPRQIFDIAVEPDGAFWLATSDGLFRHAAAIWAKGQLPNRREKPARNRLAPTKLPDEVAARAEWNVFLTARNGDVWLGGARELAWRHRNAWQFFSSTNQIGPEQVIVFDEAPDGRIVCATPDKVWEFDGRDWLVLRSGFGRVNGLSYARDGTLWVAADSGVHRCVRGAWVQNSAADGLPASAITNVREDDAGKIVATTIESVSIFQPDSDRDAPLTTIHPLANGEGGVREGLSVKLEFSGRDKWNTTTIERLLFSYRLDEREWSPFQEASEATFTDLSVGMHYFQVRSMDRNANIDPKPARLEFAIVLPWYRETRLVWILCIALAIAIFFAALAFNRHRRLQHSYADIERQVAERTRELELANRELVHSQKMNALGTLSAGIAHDFNNILSIIKGSSQIIEENLDNPTKVQTRLDRIKTVVQQGAGIVEAMLGFSRASGENAEACDVNTVVEDTLKLLGDRFLRETQVSFERGSDLPEITVARDFVQQVLLNFIFNAAEAMERQSSDRAEPKRKQISLISRLTESPLAGTVLSAAKAERYVAISVTDNGCGIAPENLPRVFEPFFTTKAMSARRGTGLGLSMVYELAKKLEAGLSVETVLGEGSTFTIFLPVRRVPVSEIKMETAIQP